MVLATKVYSSERLLCMEASMISDDDDEDTYRPIPRTPAGKPSQPWSETCVFQAGVGLVIMLNTVVIVLQTIYIHDELVWTFLERVELAFLLIYVVELLWRVCDHGCGCFARGPRWTLNWFDVICVAVGITEICRARLLNDKNSGALVARLFRVSRTLRIFRCIRFVSEIDYVIVTAARAALALAVLMALMLFVAAIFTTNILWDAPDLDVQEKFGHLGASMWSLYKIMSLDGWRQTANHVIAVNPHTLWFFVVFIFSTSFSLMALAPAVLIEVNTRHREREQHQSMVQRCKQRLQNETQIIHHLFCMADAGSGLVTVPEMQDLATESTILRQLEKLGLSTSGALRDVRLGLFDLQEELLAKEVPPDFGFNEEDILERVLFKRHDTEQALWRSTTATRMQLHDLSSFLHSELQQQKQEIQQLRDAMGDRLDVNLEAVEAAAAKGASGVGASAHREIERLCSELAGRAAAELAALAESAAAKLVSACAERPSEAQQLGPPGDGPSRPCSAFRAEESLHCSEVPASTCCSPGTVPPMQADENGRSRAPSLAISHSMTQMAEDTGLGDILQCQTLEAPIELSSVFALGPELAQAQSHGVQEQPAGGTCADELRRKAPPVGDAEAAAAARQPTDELRSEAPPVGDAEASAAARQPTDELRGAGEEDTGCLQTSGAKPPDAERNPAGQPLHTEPATEDIREPVPGTEVCEGSQRRWVEYNEAYRCAPTAAQAAQDFQGPAAPEPGGAQAGETRVAPDQHEPQSARCGEDEHGKG